MHVSDLVKSVIQTENGWAVAEQFESTFDGESFEEQNHNALDYIRRTVKDILYSKVLSENAQNELQEYMDKLEEYMEEAE